MRIGVISDTHGLLRPEALRELRGAELLIHAGDIGSAEVLEELRAHAPLVAVRGNNDRGAWARRSPKRIRSRPEASLSTCSMTCRSWTSILQAREWKR